MRSRRSAATKVMVFRRPWGSIAWRRWHLGPQLRRGMLVLTHVSSTQQIVVVVIRNAGSSEPMPGIGFLSRTAESEGRQCAIFLIAR